MKVKQHIIEEAIDESNRSTYMHKIGAVIFNKKIILGKAHNSQLKSRKGLSKKFQQWPGSIHAEVDAIISSKSELKGAAIFVLRINNKGEFRMAKPCSYCRALIKHVGIKDIYYTTNAYPYIAHERVN